jgi:hypothetical protein
MPHPDGSISARSETTDSAVPRWAYPTEGGLAPHPEDLRRASRSCSPALRGSEWAPGRLTVPGKRVYQLRRAVPVAPYQGQWTTRTRRSRHLVTHYLPRMSLLSHFLELFPASSADTAHPGHHLDDGGGSPVRAKDVRPRAVSFASGDSASDATSVADGWAPCRWHGRFGTQYLSATTVSAASLTSE